MLDHLAKKLQEQLKARKSNIKNSKTQDLEKQVATIKATIKQVDKELEPIKEAKTILKGYVTEVEAILDNGEISIFDI